MSNFIFQDVFNNDNDLLKINHQGDVTNYCKNQFSTLLAVATPFLIRTPVWMPLFISAPCPICALYFKSTTTLKNTSKYKCPFLVSDHIRNRYWGYVQNDTSEIVLLLLLCSGSCDSFTPLHEKISNLYVKSAPGVPKKHPPFSSQNETSIPPSKSNLYSIC